MDNNKQTPTIDMSTVRDEATKEYEKINSFPKDAITWHVWKNAFDRGYLYCHLNINPLLEGKDREIEELKNSHREYLLCRSILRDTQSELEEVKKQLRKYEPSENGLMNNPTNK